MRQEEPPVPFEVPRPIMDQVTPVVPPADLRTNNWRSLNPPPMNDFTATIPVTVIIPYYEAPEALDLTLMALERQSYPRDLFEVVIVDDGSKPPLETPASSPLEIRVLHQEDLGFGAARARNHGARAANHPILVFLDCDMLPEAGWLTAHARWHHTACDLLTLGFRSHVEVNGISADDIRNHRGSFADLFRGRSVDRPEWIEFHMARTNELTSTSDDIFRVVTSGNLGISRWFFEQVGGFDESFHHWGMEDTELGYRVYTHGGPLIPVREAFCWHQGEGAEPSTSERKSLEYHRAKVSHLIPHPDFRPDNPGRSFSVPRFVIAIDPLDHPPEAVLATAEEILANTLHDLVVWIGVRPDDPGYEWLSYGLGPDPRVFLGALEGGIKHFPNSPFHVTLPAGIVYDPQIVERLREILGSSAAAFGWLADGFRISIVRAWALHRSRRTGKGIEEVGEVVPIDASDLIVRPGDEATSTFSTRSLMPSKAARVLRELRSVRNPRQAWIFLRWIFTAVRLRLIGAFRRGRLRRSAKGLWWSSGSPPTTRQAQYPLGIDIAVIGTQARTVFAASGRVHYSTGEGVQDLVLADTPDIVSDIGPGGTLPLVALSEAAPRLAVAAFDPKQVNPVNWNRETNGKTGALGRGELIPSGVEIHAVFDAADRQSLSGLHHLEDTRAFHENTIQRAGTLASLAATGVIIHINDDDTELESRLGAELYRSMRDDRISHADTGLRERISIGMRRAALRSHSLRARARQVAAEADIPNYQGIPEVTIILPTKRPSLLHRSLETVAAQTYPRLELVLALHGDGFPGEIDTSDLPFHVEVVRAPSEKMFGSVLNQATEAAGGRLLTKMDDDDYYSDEHVWDLVLAHEFSGGDLVAKGAEFVYLAASDRTIHRYVGGGEIYPRSSTIAGGAMLIALHDMVEVGGWRRVHTAVDQALVTDLTRIGGRVYRTHGHGYILVRHGGSHTWNTPDSYFLHHAEEERPGCDLAFAGVEWEHG